MVVAKALIAGHDVDDRGAGEGWVRGKWRESLGILSISSL